MAVIGTQLYDKGQGGQFIQIYPNTDASVVTCPISAPSNTVEDEINNAIPKSETDFVTECHFHYAFCDTAVGRSVCSNNFTIGTKENGCGDRVDTVNCGTFTLPTLEV